jgi:DNA helicase-2/ATP-dependent DNA helicase PcrA
VEGRFPSRRAGQAQKWVLSEDVFPPEARHRYEGSEAEERRLFYVALTRARDCAYLSCFERKTNEFKPSRFLLGVAGGPVDPAPDLPLPAPAEDKKAPAQPPLAVSFSDVSLFDDCGHRYRLAAVFSFEQELAVELGYGRAIHHVLRHVAEIAQATGKPPTKAELVALIEKELYLPFANASTVEHMHKAAQRLVERYLTDYADDLKRLWAVERPFELHLEQGTLSGRADVILSEAGDADGSLSIVDYKTATDARREEQYRLQLAVYAGAGRGEGLDVTAAYIHDLKNGIRSAVDISDEATRAATSRVAGSIQGIREARFPPRPETTKCAVCDYRRICKDVPEAAAKAI